MRGTKYGYFFFANQCHCLLRAAQQQCCILLHQAVSHLGLFLTVLYSKQKQHYTIAATKNNYMTRLLLTIATAVLITTSCSKEFTKKHEAHYKLNGTEYHCNEDQTYASYYSGDSLLLVNAYTGQSSTLGVSVIVNLDHTGVDVAVTPGENGTSATMSNSAVRYFPISGSWKITSHKEGNPASRHTEGTFNFVAVNQYDNTDTVRVTDGSFYVNNY